MASAAPREAFDERFVRCASLGQPACARAVDRPWIEVLAFGHCRASSWTGRVAGPWARTLSHTHPWSSAADGTECTGSHSCGAAVSCRPFWWKPIRGHAGRYKAPDRLWRLGSSVERSAKIGEPAPPKAEGPLYGPRAGATSYAAAGAGEGAGQG